MRSELEQAAYIDRYLLDQLDEEACTAFEEKMARDPELATTVRAQGTTHSLVRRFYARQEQLNEIFHSLMKERTFAAQIKTLFA